MMKRLIACAAPLALLLPAPATAQAEDPKAAMQGFAEAMQSAFVAEPLTAEEEMRLPLAQSIVAKVIPDGTYAEMMGDMIDAIVGPMASMMPSTMPAGELAAALGVEEYQIADLESAQLEALSLIVEPEYARRGEVGMRFMMEEMTSIFGEMEPALRDGMARAYAVRFNDQELADIAAFFATPTGSDYASESFLVMADPQVTSASMEMLPALMERMPAMMEGVEARLAELPAPRKFVQLTPEERADVAAMLGISVEQLKTNMQAAN